MRKVISVDIKTIIDLIVCAEDYGFETLYPDFFEMLNHKLSDEEIEDYVSHMLEDDIYSEEDTVVRRERLERLREEYGS